MSQAINHLSLKGALVTLGLIGLAVPSLAADLSVGDIAPAFDLAGSDGKRHKLTDYRGRFVVLAWFPKAFTGG